MPNPGLLTVKAYQGDGAVLLAFSLDEAELRAHNLAGFAIHCKPPKGPEYDLLNRLNFTAPVTSATTPDQRPWTSSKDAPFQKFHWVHFPPDVMPGTYEYTVTARYWDTQNRLTDGPSASVKVDHISAIGGNFEVGLTRGYISSQAYADRFKNKDIRTWPKTLDYATTPFQPQYEWLGGHARRMIFDFLKESVNDLTISVDMFAYDLDEPDILSQLEALQQRLRAILDNAPLHTGTALEVTAAQRLIKSAGQKNIVQGHFKRFSHDKILIQKKNGQVIKVLTGSANFSVRGLYVQANNVLVFKDPSIANHYEQVFESVFTDMRGFAASALAKQWFQFQKPIAGVPACEVSFAPHQSASISLDKVLDAVTNAKSSVMFAIMELQGGGPLLDTIKNLHESGKVFSYGMTQSGKGFNVYKPGEKGVLVPFDYLHKQVPKPFQAEFSGGPGQVIHDKFIVVDFNDADPVVFTGSSNLSKGGEENNGDNLIAIYDRQVAAVFAVEAMRLVDHYQFRNAMESATAADPLTLQGSSGNFPWWSRDYDPNDIRNVERELLAYGKAEMLTP